MKIESTFTATGDAAAATPRVVPGIVALLLGTVFLLGTGFIPVEAVHNAAHDARHAFAFPCH